jgi:hypothetical protein
MTQSNLPADQQRATTPPGADSARSKAATSTQPGGKGMPARTPDDVPLERGPNAMRASPQDQSEEASLELPNDRDQATDMTADTPDPMIRQAARDVQQGKQDTSKSAETDQAYGKLRQS